MAPSLKIRGSSLADHPRYAELSHAAFDVPISRELRMLAEVDPSQVLVGEFDGQVVAQAFVHRLGCWINGRVMTTAGVAGLVTAEGYRSRGFATELLGSLLERLRDTAVPLATLYPSTYRLYQRMGWAVGDRTLRYSGFGSAFAPANVPEREGDAGVECRPLVLGDLSTIAAVRQSCGSLVHGRIERDIFGWRLRILEEFSSGSSTWNLAVHRDSTGAPDGYAYYVRAHDGSVLVQELLASRPTAHQRLLAYLATTTGTTRLTLMTNTAFPTMARRVSSAQHLRVDVVPHLQAMHRIVDVRSAFEDRQVSDADANGKCVLRVLDESCPWNAGDWHIEWEGGHITCNKVRGESVDANVDIGTMVQMYFGAITTLSAIRSGDLSVERPRARAALSALFMCSAAPFSADHF
jgi:predicted acetyltransferase